jgi:hypothetical protein
MKIKKTFETTVGGLAFYPVDKEGVYMSIKAWLTAGSPNNVYVYDNVDTLKVTGIPICDATYFGGLYKKIPKRLKPRKVVVHIVPSFLKELTEAQVQTKIKGIKASATQKHHKMSY